MFDHIFSINENLFWEPSRAREETEQENEMDTEFEEMLDGLDTKNLAELSEDELGKVKWAVFRSSQRPYDTRVVYVFDMNKVYEDIFYEKPTKKAIFDSLLASWRWSKQRAREEATA